MKPIEYCLDKILNQLVENREKDPRAYLKADELLKDFELKEHEYFKGMIMKLENEKYLQFKDINAADVNYSTAMEVFTEKTLITVQGYYFIKNQNGYTGLITKSRELFEAQEKLRKEQENQRKLQADMGERMEKIQKRNLVLTVILAVGAGVASVYYIMGIFGVLPH